MKNIQKITMAGLPGAGKTELIKKLSEYYSLPLLSIGTLRRDFALSKNMTIDELNAQRLSNKSLDLDFDNFQKRYMEENPKWIVEGRLPYFFAPSEAVKLFLSVDKYEGAKRIFKAKRDSEEKYYSIEEVLKKIDERMKSDKTAYWELYKTNCYDVSQFDIIVDTTELLPNQVLKTVIRRIDNL